MAPANLIGWGDSRVDVTFDQPRSIEKWQQLEVADKYRLETLKRLKAGDEKLAAEGIETSSCEMSWCLRGAWILQLMIERK